MINGTDLGADEVATFVAMVTAASVTMKQSESQRRLYVRLMVDGLRPTAQQGAAQHRGAGRATKRGR